MNRFVIGPPKRGYIYALIAESMIKIGATRYPEHRPFNQRRIGDDRLVEHVTEVVVTDEIDDYRQRERLIHGAVRWARRFPAKSGLPREIYFREIAPWVLRVIASAGNLQRLMAEAFRAKVFVHNNIKNFLPLKEWELSRLEEEIAQEKKNRPGIYKEMMNLRKPATAKPKRGRGK